MSKNKEPFVWKAKNIQQQEPFFWKSKKVKSKKKKRAKLTFFKIGYANGQLDFLLTKKMLKHRRKAAKNLFKSAQKNYDKCRKELAQVGRKKISWSKIEKLERDLVYAKFVQAQVKEYYRLAKNDFKKHK